MTGVSITPLRPTCDGCAEACPNVFEVKVGNTTLALCAVCLIKLREHIDRHVIRDKED